MTGTGSAPDAPAPERRRTDGGRPVLLFRGDGPETVRILAFHGGGGLAGGPEALAPVSRALAAGGAVTVAAAGYRTRATDTDATLDDMLADAAAALAWCRAEMPAGGRLYLLGVSFGGLLALHAAMEDPAGIEGLILINPVTDIGPGGFANAVVPEGGRPTLSPLRRYPGHPLCRQLRLFIAHAEQDPEVPVSAVRDLAMLWPTARCRLVTFPHSGPGFFNRPPNRDRVAAMVRDFIGPVAAEAPPAQAVTAAASGPRLPEGTTLVYGIGAQKAGTTWLYGFLKRHPECLCQDMKELHYFDVMHARHESSHYTARIAAIRALGARLSDLPGPENARTLDQIERMVERLRVHSGARGDHGPYLSYLLKGHAGHKAVCDITPSYATLDRVAFAEMDRLGPARFVFILRDPVGRLWSQIRMMVEAKGIDPVTPDYAASCAARARELSASGRLPTLPRAHYARTMAELEAVVPADRIHYVFYEDLFRQDTVDALCAFLGVAARPAETGERINAGHPLPIPDEIEALLLEGLAVHYEAAFARFGDGVPAAWRERYARRPPPRPGLVGKLLGR
jgi:pimeloyl-ACP methyl ester carboxylesterase